jgi:hypothetical protein
MKKILRTTIVCLLVPSFVFAQIPHQYGTNEPSVKQTNLARVWDALNTEIGQQIVSYIETTVGSINLEQAKAFMTAKGEVAFVPIKSFGKVLAALCYRQLEDGSEYLFLMTYTAKEKGVAFTFPSGQMYVMKSSGVEKSANPDFQFQQYDDLSNKVSINANSIILLSCLPAELFFLIAANIASFVYILIFKTDPCYFPPFLGGGCDEGYIALVISLVVSFPLLFIALAYSYPDLNLEMTSILLFAVYYYGCVLAFSTFFS